MSRSEDGQPESSSTSGSTSTRATLKWDTVTPDDDPLGYQAMLRFYESTESDVLRRTSIDRPPTTQEIKVAEDRIKSLETRGRAWIIYSRGMMAYKLQECADWREQADLAFWLLFNQTPYSNFTMLEALFSAAGITPKDYLKDQGLLKKRVKDKGYIKDMARQIINARLTVFAEAGRCTTLAIEVANLLRDADRKVFDFEHFDVGGHRLARCKNTGILIDSASPTGPVIVQDHLWKKIKDDPQMRKWKYTEGSSKYRSLNRNGVGVDKISKNKILATEALEQCLGELALQKTDPLCYFRSFKFTPSSGIAVGQTEYHGMVKWCPKNKQLVLLPSKEQQTTTGAKLVTIQWETMATQSKTLISRVDSKVAVFISQYGGPYSSQQWYLKNIKPMHTIFLESAFELWGGPHIYEGGTREDTSDVLRETHELEDAQLWVKALRQMKSDGSGTDNGQELQTFAS